MVSRNELPYSLCNESERTEYVTMMYDPGTLNKGWVVDNPQWWESKMASHRKLFWKILLTIPQQCSNVNNVETENGTAKTVSHPERASDKSVRNNQKQIQQSLQEEARKGEPNLKDLIDRPGYWECAFLRLSALNGTFGL